MTYVILWTYEVAPASEHGFARCNALTLSQSRVGGFIA